VKRFHFRLPLCGTLGVIALTACGPPAGSPAPRSAPPDTTAIVLLARTIAADSFRGRGPWTPENARVARLLADSLARLGARPLFGTSLLVPFVTPDHPRDTVLNVAGVLPNRHGAVAGELVGITAHLDHLGIGPPDARGDSIYNGFLDDAIGVAMVMQVARHFARAPGERALAVLYFNLEEQGLLGSQALAARPEATALAARLRLLIGVDAGAPAGEAQEWQLMGGSPPHEGTRIADSLARAHGWTTTATPPRPISDVYPFARLGVPILFPIPGKTWRGYSAAGRDSAMARFDHYHQPADEWRPDFPLTGTAAFARWLWDIVRVAARQ
jgi:Zn-dependent M28 family amino/carboxypeptidase